MRRTRLTSSPNATLVPGSNKKNPIMVDEFKKQPVAYPPVIMVSFNFHIVDRTHATFNGDGCSKRKPRNMCGPKSSKYFNLFFIYHRAT